MFGPAKPRRGKPRKKAIMDIRTPSVEALATPCECIETTPTSSSASRARHDLESELALKSLILDHSIDGCVAHTPDGRLLYFNARAATQLGYDPEEFSVLGPYGWVHPSCHTGIQHRLGLLREHRSLLFPSLGASKDGETLHTEVHAQLLPIDGDEIVVSVIRDVTERVKQHEQITHLAFHDRLTDLPNRMKLEDDLRTALGAAERHDDLVGVIFIDLDDFKPVNDRFGHSAGDEVLRVVAERMASCVRACDTVARLGGDEFLVLVSRIARREDLALVARKLADSIAAPIELGCGATVHITLSEGLAVYERGESAEDLMNRADHEMYRAKEAGVAGWEAFLGDEGR